MSEGPGSEADGDHDGARRESATRDGAPPPDAGRRGGVVAPPPDGGRVQHYLEYVTFGYGVHHLLKVVLLQFAVLFLDVDLLAYTRRAAAPGRADYVTVTWLLASFGFLGILATLVRQVGRRTLTPRFHRRRHLLGSVAGYLLASGISFLFGYVTFVLPGADGLDPTVSYLLPGWLLTVVFATFVAIGYHAQVAATDHPTAHAITDAVVGWLDSLDWVEEDPNSLARAEAYEAFQARTDDLEALLTEARTVEARRLEADFREWRERFETRSRLSQRLVVEGRTDGPGSDRLAAEHEVFLDLRRRLGTLAGVEE